MKHDDEKPPEVPPSDSAWPYLPPDVALEIRRLLAEALVRDYLAENGKKDERGE